jgi:hypothetical protein
MRYHKLIVENRFEDSNDGGILKVFTEDAKVGEKPSLAKFEARLIQTEIDNRNGRNYPKRVMVPVVEKYVRDRIVPGAYRSYGELGHPEGVEINLDRVSHIITEMRWEGNDVLGKSQLLDTANGRIADTILRSNCKLGVSTRGMGALDEEFSGPGDKVVEFDLVAIDIVADPSAPQGWVRGICENRQYIIDDGRYQAVQAKAYENLDKTLSSLPKKEVDKYLTEALKKFFKEFHKPI